MAIDDEVFIGKVNEIARENHLRLPSLRSGETPTGAFLAEWAKFLEDCVKKGIALSDERWQRLTLESRIPHVVFGLELGASTAGDPDFRVGLQLLMGLLEKRDSEN